jgi:ATP-binding cassette subfamily B protein
MNNKIKQELHLEQDYTFSSNLLFWLRRVKTNTPLLIIIIVVGILAQSIAQFTTVYFPKLVIDLLGVKPTINVVEFIIPISALGIIFAVVTFLATYGKAYIDDAIGMLGVDLMIKETSYKRMTMNYSNFFNPEFDKADKRLGNALVSNHSMSVNFLKYLSDFLICAICFVVYAVIISFMAPFALPLLFAGSLINWLMNRMIRMYEEKSRGERAELEKKLDAMSDYLFEMGAEADIRLYGLVNVVKTIWNNDLKSKLKLDNILSSKDRSAAIIAALVVLIRDLGAYIYLLYMFLHGMLSLGDFVMVFAAIASFATWINGVVDNAGNMMRASSETKDIRRFLDFPDYETPLSSIPNPIDTTQKTSELVLSKDCGAVDIALRSLSYKYPGSDKAVLTDINLTIKSGEKIALVGVNGAGKTTLIKLICGLLEPVTGEVLMNGHRIMEYPRDKYFELISVVFQDVNLLALSLAQNISQDTVENTDVEKVSKCLELAGLSDKVAELPNGINTLLVKEVNNDATSFSGGQLQRLAIARALYKNAPLMILDEPTSALDPIAEARMYEDYADITKGKTSIFISHRLASTKFCDRILLLDGHTITEEGTHDELMQLNGTYANMFRVQAKYYMDNMI